MTDLDAIRARLDAASGAPVPISLNEARWLVAEVHRLRETLLTIVQYGNSMHIEASIALARKALDGDAS